MSKSVILDTDIEMRIGTILDCLKRSPLVVQINVFHR